MQTIPYLLKTVARILEQKVVFLKDCVGSEVEAALLPIRTM